MEDINIYDDVSHVDLGSEILKLEDQNKNLLDHIRKLEGDIMKLCGELTNMKEKQQNLSKNISELYKTAKLEIQRKERIIADLQQEIDDLRLGRQSNPHRYKRQLPSEKDGNEPPKRFKNNHNETETAWKSEKRECTLPENTDTYETHDTDTTRTHRDYRNDETNRNSRYSSSSVRGRNRWNRRGRNNRYANPYRRSRSSERFRRSRSLERFRSGSKERDRRSRERDRRSRSKERDRRSTSNERFNRNENQNRRRGDLDGYRSGNNRRSRSVARKNSCKSEDRFSGKDVESYGNLRGNPLRSNSRHKECIEVLDLDNSLEDGEISSESDNLVIEEDVRNTSNKRIPWLPNKRDMKPISIEEYRNRNKIEETETIIIEGDTNIKKTTKAELLTTPKDCREPKSEKRTTNDSGNLQDRSKTPIPNNSSDFSLRGVETKAADDHILSKSLTKEVNDISLDDSNGGLKSAKDNNNSSVNSNNSSFANNSGNITNVSNTTVNGGVGLRRRRCVIIGLKEKV